MALEEIRGAAASFDPHQRVDELLVELRQLRERISGMEDGGAPPDEAEEAFSRLITAVGAVLQEAVHR